MNNKSGLPQALRPSLPFSPLIRLNFLVKQHDQGTPLVIEYLCKRPKLVRLALVGTSWWPYVEEGGGG